MPFQWQKWGILSRSVPISSSKRVFLRVLGVGGQPSRCYIHTYCLQRGALAALLRPVFVLDRDLFVTGLTAGFSSFIQIFRNVCLLLPKSVSWFLSTFFKTVAFRLPPFLASDSINCSCFDVHAFGWRQPWVVCQKSDQSNLHLTVRLPRFACSCFSTIRVLPAAQTGSIVPKTCF